jgi:S1-C subfamily serine protease
MYSTLALAMLLGAPALKEKEQPKGPGFLGITFQKNPDAGVVVTQVRPDSPALKAGIKAYDVLLKINDVELKDSDTTDIVKMISGIRAGTTVSIQLRRGKEMVTVKAKLAVRPPDADRVIIPDDDEIILPPP